MDIIGSLIRNNVPTECYQSAAETDLIRALHEGQDLECSNLTEAVYLFYCVMCNTEGSLVTEYYSGNKFCGNFTQKQLLTGSYEEYKAVSTYAKHVAEDFKSMEDGRSVTIHPIDVHSLYTRIQSAVSNDIIGKLLHKGLCGAELVQALHDNVVIRSTPIVSCVSKEEAVYVLRTAVRGLSDEAIRRYYDGDKEAVPHNYRKFLTGTYEQYIQLLEYKTYIITREKRETTDYSVDVASLVGYDISSLVKELMSVVPTAILAKNKTEDEVRTLLLSLKEMLL